MIRTLIAIMLALPFATLGIAHGAERSAFLKMRGPATPPMGWVQFCRDLPEDCKTRKTAARVISLNHDRWKQLVIVNAQINAAIEQVSDLDHYGLEEYWTYPVDGKGDCEDIVLEKKRRLVALGWASESLLITVVRDLDGEGHAVLTVVSDRGDLVLDNHTDTIRLWHETGYQFVKRQSQLNPNLWERIDTMPAADPAMVARSGQP